MLKLTMKLVVSESFVEEVYCETSWDIRGMAGGQMGPCRKVGRTELGLGSI